MISKQNPYWDNSLQIAPWPPEKMKLNCKCYHLACGLWLLQVENLEELLKEKDNQVDIARTKLSAVQAQTFSSEGTVTSLEEALADRDKQINQLREQRDRAEKENKEEKELHEREITDYKMKLHSVESEV